MRQKKILFLVPYPLHKAPSQRFRVEAFFYVLDQNKIEYRVEPFLNEKTWDVLYKGSSSLKKAAGVLQGFLKRCVTVFLVVPKYEFVFVHREASPIGPPIFEFLAAKIFRKKLIFDFDDAIWMVNSVTPNPFVDWIKAFWKIGFICKWSYKISGGNEFLCDYARRHNQNVILIPTSVDTCRKFNKEKFHSSDKPVVIGWTGSHTTMPYLDMIFPVIEKLSEKYQIAFLVISNKKPSYDLPNMQYLQWSEATETEDLLKFDIGIMPMFRDVFSQGKCGFKIIQYLSVGIPAVATPVGVNTKIIENGVNGFLCEAAEEWYQKLSMLIEDCELRKNFGKAGMQKIKEEYSIKANEQKFLQLFS